MDFDVTIKFKKVDERAVLPTVAYNGTSACFDLMAIEDTVIPARGYAMVPNGLRAIIPHGWYVEFATRSGMGIGKNLRIHPGIIDTGYCGDLGVKVFNLSDEDITIKANTGVAQCKTVRKPVVNIAEATDEEWEQYIREALRGESGFGSSDK